MFGGKAVATKAFIIILLILAIAWILYSFNFSLPKINFQVDKKLKNKVEGRRSKVENNDDEDEEEVVKPNFGQPVSRSLIKSLIKDKLERKIEEKEKAKEKKARPTINFSAEKPTFSVNTLEISPDQSVTIDETFLMEKAKALQNKLMEFNVPIMIE
jgi:hypothetical protein